MAAGASLPLIGKALNHSNQQTTAIYARLQLDPVRAALEANAMKMLAVVSRRKGRDSMPKKTQPTSKAAEMPTHVTEIHLPYLLNSSQTEKQFVYQISQLAKSYARQIYRHRYPRPQNKGGRPSIETLVWEAADKVWARWGRKFPAKRSAFVHLLNKVNKTLLRKSRDTRTTAKFLKQWMECNLSFSQYPETLIRLPPRKGQEEDLLRLEFGLVAISDFARSCGPDFADMLAKRKKLPTLALSDLKQHLAKIASAEHQTLATLYLSNRKN